MHSNGLRPSRIITTNYTEDLTYSIVMEWHKDGLLQRDGDLPARIFIDVVLRGDHLIKVTEKTWYEDGERSDRPMESSRESI
jgi:hypothetical protein